MACGSGRYGRLAQAYGDEKNLKKFTICKINRKTFPGVSFIKIACGAGHVISISNEYQVFSWGKCHFGQLGHGDEDVDRFLPRRISALESIPVKEISAQDSASFAVTESGELYSWGCGYYGALGTGNENSSFVPVLVSFPKNSNVHLIGCGKFHTIVWTDVGLFGFGLNKEGQLGSGDILNKYTPSPIDFLEEESSVISIACGDESSWIATKEKLFVSGFNTPTFSIVDTFPLGGSNLKQIAARHKMIGIVSDAGKIFSSYPGKGVLFECSPSSENFTYIECGETHFIGIDTKGNVHTWGNDHYGKLGRVLSASPKLPNLPHAIQVAAGSNQSYALIQ